jgi:hypothetical protein
MADLLAARRAIEQYRLDHAALHAGAGVKADLTAGHEELKAGLTSALEEAGYDSILAFEVADLAGMAAAEEKGKVDYEASLPMFTTSAIKALRVVDISGITLHQWRNLSKACRALRSANSIPDSAYLWLNDTPVLTYPDTAEGLAMKTRAEMSGLTTLPITKGGKPTNCYGSGYLWTGTAILALVLGSSPQTARKTIDAIAVKTLIGLGLSSVTVRGNNYKVNGLKVASWGGIEAAFNMATCNIIAVTYNLDYVTGSTMFSRDLSASVYQFAKTPSKDSVIDTLQGAVSAVLANPSISVASLNPAELAVL